MPLRNSSDGYNAGMSEERKKPVWQWIIGLLVMAPVLYVASFGPVCRAIPLSASYHVFHPLETFYKPLILAVRYTGRECLSDAICWYGGETGLYVYVSISIGGI